jgi:hypothetical protein
MKKLLIFLSLFLITKPSFSQSVKEPTFSVDNTVYEKVYVHIDREMYSPRETIWFKVYAVGGINNQLLKGYKNVYVQLVNDTGRVVNDRLILTSDGVAMGDFALPYTIDEGQYTIRAYTKYLENFGEESYFHKKIWISSMKQQTKAQKEFRLEDIDIGFYPESGNLVLNASNWIAFKAIDTTGRGLPIAGQIVNDLGDTITAFNSEFLGMGKFSLMPKEGRKYFALLDEYLEYRYEVKDIRPEGVTMHFVDNGSEVSFVLARNFTLQNTENLTISVTHKGIDLFAEPVVMNAARTVLSFSKSKFPLGISKVTLMDSTETILAERIVFIHTGIVQQIAVESDSKVYETRNAVKLNLQSLLEADDTIKGGLSVAVVNRSYLNRSGYNVDIRSTLLLDSELKGPIESSASYFSDGRISSTDKLNLLMMVQGWRSYYWPEIISKLPKNLDDWDDYGLSVAGSVKELFRNDMVKYGKVKLGPFSAQFTFLDTVTNGNGRFRFERLFLRDSSTLIVEAKNERGRSNTEIFLDHMYEPDTLIRIASVNDVTMDPLVPYSYYRESFSKLEADRKHAIESGSNWIEEVTIVKEKPLSFAELDQIESKALFGDPDKRVKITDDEMTYLNIYDYLESNPVMGVYVSGETVMSRSGERITVLVDGFSGVNAKHTPMGDIDYIDFMTSGAKKALFGSKGGGGVILVYTKKGELSTFERYVKGRLTKKVNGYQWPHDFYSQKYTLENIELEKPDYRPTLFWEPFVFLEDNKAELEFFTSDYISDFVVIVEGISQGGKICTGLCEFYVGK